MMVRLRCYCQRRSGDKFNLTPMAKLFQMAVQAFDLLSWALAGARDAKSIATCRANRK